MSLAFFRKNEKLVFWIMIVLMIAFAAGVAGRDVLSGVFRSISSLTGGGDKTAIGYAGSEKITVEDIAKANMQLQILTGPMGLGSAQRVLIYGEVIPGERGLLALQAGEQQPKAWALLTREAKQLGMTVSDARVDSFLEFMSQALGVTVEGVITGSGGQYQRDQIRQAVRDYLAVADAFSASHAQVDISEPQLRSLYDQLSSRITIAAVAIEAEPFLDQVAEPSDEQVRTLFQAARAFRPGEEATLGEFRFGYVQPPAVKIEYALIDYDQLRESIQPTNEQISQYFQANRESLVRTIPAEDPNAEPQTRPYESPSEARGVITERLKTQQAEARMTRLAEQMIERVESAEQAQTPPAGETALARAAGELIQRGEPVQYHSVGSPMSQAELAGDEVLGSARDNQGRPLATLAFSVEELAGASQEPAAVTLGQVYRRPMRVRTPAGRRGMLVWSIQAVDQGGAPEEMTDEIRQDVENDLKLAAAYDLALAQAQQIMADAQTLGLHAAAEQQGGEVAIVGPFARLAMSQPMPTSIEQMQAQQLARFVSSSIQAGQDPREQLQMVPPEMLTTAALMPQLALVRPGNLAPAPRGAEDQFIEAAFSLAPAQPVRIEDEVALPAAETQPTTEPASQPTTFPTSAPAEAGTLTLLELPNRGVVLVLQRVAYEPAYEGALAFERRQLIDMLHRHERRMAEVRWYSLGGVAQRMQYSDNNP